MKYTFILAICVAGIAAVPSSTFAQSFKESFECTFKRGLANRPTPRKVVFSVDEYGRSALLHDVQIPEIDTNVGSGQIKQNTPRYLSISWVGRNYTFSETGLTYATNEARIDAIDLVDHEFSVRFDRKSMKATAKSRSLSSYMPRDGFAKGKCTAIALPKS